MVLSSHSSRGSSLENLRRVGKSKKVVKRRGVGVLVFAGENHLGVLGSREDLDGSGPGMGLGLASAKRLVQAPRGKIGFESVPRQGGTFTFWLPIEHPQNPGGEEGR